MTGLDKILNGIEDEAIRVSGGLMKKAELEIEGILDAARKTGTREAMAIIDSSEKNAKEIISRSKSSAALERKRRLLEVKRELISNTIDDATTSLLKLPVKDYFEVLLEMVVKFASPRRGEIVFSEADLARLNDEQKKQILDAAKVKGSELVISAHARDIDGGFVLVYGGIEENCSFGALFGSSRDKIFDKVNEVLFRGVDDSAR